MGYAVVRVAAKGFVWLQSSTPRVSDVEKLGLDEKRNMSEKILEEFGEQCRSVRLCYEVLIGCIEESMDLAEHQREVKAVHEERDKALQAKQMAQLLDRMRDEDKEVGHTDDHDDEAGGEVLGTFCEGENEGRDELLQSGRDIA
jgi:hypothetical protein